MKKILMTVLILGFLVTNAQAELYVTLSKTTGEPQGTVNINEKAVADWAESFILVEAGKEYQGKHGYEMKYENQELRLATQEEIDEYLISIEPPTDEEVFMERLNNALDNDEEIKTKIKELKP